MTLSDDGGPSLRHRVHRETGDGKVVDSSEQDAKSTGPPDNLWCLEDTARLASLTGLRREDFGKDEPSYVKAIANMVSPPRLPDSVPELPDHFVRPTMVDDTKTKFLDNVTGNNPCHMAITGMGGAGKTLIASAVVHDTDIRQHFGDGILWFNDEAHGYKEHNFLLNLNAIAKQFQELVLKRCYRQGRVFQYESVYFKSVQEAQEYFGMWKKKHSLRCLLVVDNAWNSVRAQTFYPDDLPIIQWAY